MFSIALSLKNVKVILKLFDVVPGYVTLRIRRLLNILRTLSRKALELLLIIYGNIKFPLKPGFIVLFFS